MRAVMLALGGSVACSAIAAAQIGSAALIGTVSDEAGAAVAGALVTISSGSSICP
jgi:hypothetical protein